MPTGPRPMTKLQLAAREKRRRIYDLRRENASWEEIGRAMGFEPATCEKYYRESLKKDGLEPLGSPDAKSGKAFERRDPQAAASILATLGATTLIEPADAKYDRLKELCREAGMKPALVNALIKRLAAGNYSPVTSEVKRLVGKDLTDALETKTAMVLSYIDDFALSQAGLKDLAIAANIMIEKTQLLKNLPTQILDFTSRKQVNELLPAMVSEARRRGLTLEGSSTRVDDAR